MIRKTIASAAGFGLLALVMLLAACNANMHETQQSVPTIRVEKISVNQLPALDPIRTYYLGSSNLPDPEALLTSMWMNGIPVSQAWLPLDDRCADPIGVRFTVELAVADPRIAQFGFVMGQGHLTCATQLNQYTIAR